MLQISTNAVRTTATARTRPPAQTRTDLSPAPALAVISTPLHREVSPGVFVVGSVSQQIYSKIQQVSKIFWRWQKHAFSRNVVAGAALCCFSCTAT